MKASYTSKKFFSDLADYFDSRTITWSIFYLLDYFPGLELPANSDLLILTMLGEFYKWQILGVLSILEIIED